MSASFQDSLPPFFDEDIPVDHQQCRLLGPTSLVVQGLMGILVVFSLVYKRHRESPKRPWRIWAFDVSKQVVGQMFVHGSNLLISGVGGHQSAGNPCAVYFLNILIDTTLGVGLIYCIHRLLIHVFSNMFQFKGFHSGQYGTPPSLCYWARQAAVYVTSLTTMKLIVIGLFAAWPGIFKIGDLLLGWTGGRDEVQVIFVMGLFPIAMNVLQFWLIDSIVKAASQDDELLPNSSPRDSADREPLFNDSGSDDEDDDLASTMVADLESTPLPSSSSQSIGSKATLVEEQKVLPSCSSSHEPDQSEERQRYQRRSSSVFSNTPTRGSLISRSSLPRRSRRKCSPPVALELKPMSKHCNHLEHVITIVETPSTGRKSVQGTDSPRPTIDMRISPQAQH